MATDKGIYGIREILRDCGAGLSAGMATIPLAIVFAVASGISPERGLYAAIAAGVIALIFMKRQPQVLAPSVMLITALQPIMSHYGNTGVAITGIMAGILLLAMKALKMQHLIIRVPLAASLGITAGIATTIVIQQTGNFLDLQGVPLVPLSFWKQLNAYKHSGGDNLFAEVISIGTILIIILWPKITFRIPGMLVAMLVITPMAHRMNMPYQMIAQVVHKIPPSIPHIAFSHVDVHMIGRLILPAIGVAAIIAIYTAQASVIAQSTGSIPSNNGWVQTGVANIASSIIGCMPVAPALSRSVALQRDGSHSRLSTAVQILVLAAAVSFLRKWLVFIPMPLVAAILISVAFGMVSVRHLFVVLQQSWRNIILFALAWVGTLLAGAGIMAIAALIYAAWLYTQQDEKSELYSPHVPAENLYSSEMPAYTIESEHSLRLSPLYAAVLLSVRKPPRSLVLMTGTLAPSPRTIPFVVTFVKQCNLQHSQPVIVTQEYAAEWKQIIAAHRQTAEIETSQAAALS